MTRSFHIRPFGVVLAVSVLALLSTAYLGATAYLIYRDDLLGGSLARQVGMQRAYEDRIAALRAEIDRVTSRHVVARQGIGEQVALLLERQALIGRRQQELDSLVATARGAGIDVSGVDAPGPQPKPAALVTPASPAPVTLSYAPKPIASDAEIITGSVIRGQGAEPNLNQNELKPVLTGVGAQLNEAEQRQSLTLDALTTATEARAQELSSALAPLGVSTGTSVHPAAPGEPQGGPFIPAAPLHFVEELSLLRRQLHAVVGLQLRADALPLRTPVRAARLSSRFGTRNDPFLHRPAFHAGLDFVAATGAEVRATGEGVVVSAGWSGGYGQLIEIRHADGFTTRYGHLSAVLVKPGQRIAADALIGLVGSTGRSTGAHLHYETRRDGEPIDPAFFLAAGRAL